MDKMDYFQEKLSKNTEGVLDRNKNKKLFLYLTLTFIVATVVGTLSHEFGHYIVAKSLGYDADIHYAFTTWDRDDSDALTDSNNIFYILRIFIYKVKLPKQVFNLFLTKYPSSLPSRRSE